MSLLGGLVTLVGTSTNIIVSQVREETLGKPFAMFDFAPVGLGLTVLGLSSSASAGGCCRATARASAGLDEAAARAAYTTEATVPDDLPDGLEDDRRPRSRQGRRAARARSIGLDGSRSPLSPDAELRPGDVLVLEGDDAGARSAVRPAAARARARRRRRSRRRQPSEEMRSIEAVVQPESVLVGTLRPARAAAGALWRQAARRRPHRPAHHRAPARRDDPRRRRAARCRLARRRCRAVSRAARRCCRWPSGRCSWAAAASASARS